MDDAEVGERLRELRDSRGLSQLDLSGRARTAGWDSAYPQTILKVEKGTRSLKLTEAVAVTAALGVDLAALMGVTDPAVLWNDGEVIALVHEVINCDRAVEAETHQFALAWDRLTSALHATAPLSESVRSLGQGILDSTQKRRTEHQVQADKGSAYLQGIRDRHAAEQAKADGADEAVDRPTKSKRRGRG